MRVLALKSRVVAALAADSRTADAAVDVMVQGEAITIEGWVRLQSSLDALAVVASRVEGVGEVECQVAVPTGFPV